MTSPFSDWRPSPTGETFVFMHHEWNIDEAKRILLARIAAGKRQRVYTLNVADTAQLLQRTVTRPDGSVSMISVGVRVPWDRLDDVDMSVPVLLAWTRTGSLMLIDGWKRLAKATLVGVTELPAVALTKQESMRTWL